MLEKSDEEGRVTDFRYYCLNDENRIIVGANVEAPDLRSAIRAAYDACRDHPHFSSARIEVWQGATMLYATADGACDGNPACVI